MLFGYGASPGIVGRWKLLVHSLGRHVTLPSPWIISRSWRTMEKSRWVTATPYGTSTTEHRQSKRAREAKPSNIGNGTPYTAEEDLIIINHRSRQASWPTIQAALPHRSSASLRGRWERFLRSRVDFDTLLIKPFTSSEKATIVRLRKSGVPWEQIHRQYFPSRARESLRSWFNIVLANPALPVRSSREAWSTQDRQKLIQLRDEFGQPWAKIYPQFPGRSAHAMRTIYKYYGRGRRSTRYSDAEDEKLSRLRVRTYCLRYHVAPLKALC